MWMRLCVSSVWRVRTWRRRRWKIAKKRRRRRWPNTTPPAASGGSWATAPSDQGYGKPTYPAGASLACLFDGRPDFDAMAGTAVPQVDATLYLPRDSVLLPDDRVQVTHIHGLAILSPLTYEIVAGPTVDYMTMVAKLRLVTE